MVDVVNMVCFLTPQVDHICMYIPYNVSQSLLICEFVFNNKIIS